MRFDYSGVKVSTFISLLIAKHIHDFDSFSDDISNVDKFTIDSYIEKIRNGKTFLLNGKSVDFYNKYKDFIDDIYKYTNMFTFMVAVYKNENIVRKEYAEIVNYFKFNIDNINRIVELLESIDDLHISDVVLDEDNEFKNEFKVNTNRWEISDFAFGSNIRVVPSYEENVIKYYLDGTDYVIPMTYEMGKIDRNVVFGNIIVVKNLLFDPTKLPVAKDKRNTMDVIIKAKEEQKDMLKSYRDDIELSLIVDEINKTLDTSLDKIKTLSSICDMDAAIDYLLSLRDKVRDLRNLSEENESKMLQDYGDQIDKTRVEREKNRVAKRKKIDKYHLD